MKAAINGMLTKWTETNIQLISKRIYKGKSTAGAAATAVSMDDHEKIKIDMREMPPL